MQGSQLGLLRGKLGRPPSGGVGVIRVAVSRPQRLPNLAILHDLLLAIFPVVPFIVSPVVPFIVSLILSIAEVRSRVVLGLGSGMQTFFVGGIMITIHVHVFALRPSMGRVRRTRGLSLDAQAARVFVAVESGVAVALIEGGDGTPDLGQFAVHGIAQTDESRADADDPTVEIRTNSAETTKPD